MQLIMMIIMMMVVIMMIIVMMVVIMMEYWVVGQASLVDAQPPVILVICTCKERATDQ